MSNRRGNAEAPTVSVLLAVPLAWRGSVRRLAGSIDSILSQTMPALELIVVDQGADLVPETLAAYADPRIRLLATAPAAAAWEEGFGEASGRYLALLEPGDVAQPTRLARQIAYLEARPDIVLLGTATRTLAAGIPRPSHDPPVAPPALLGWKLLLGLPPATGSLMVPARAARTLPEGLGPAGEQGSHGLDLCLRLSRLGAIARLDDALTLLADDAPRWTDGAAARVAELLALAYEGMFAGGAPAAASLVAQHIGCGAVVAEAADLQALGQAFAAITDSAAARAPAGEVAAIRAHAAEIWACVDAAALRHGMSRAVLQAARPPGIAAPVLPRNRSVRARRAPPPGTDRQPGRLFSNVYEPCPADASDPPSLFAVVDTEAEFDWSKPFTRDLTSVNAMDDIERGQSVFDAYGLRPIYVVDYPVASQPRGFAKLRAIMERDGCEIGAHLHPWTTPPFEEPLSARNSYPGNLDPSLEERKLAVLMAVIRQNFGMSPVFYKAGRYGFGPSTPLALEKHGIRIDLSVLPGADLRRQGGPDFRDLKPVLYRIAGTGVLSLPMTRSEVGFLPAMARLGEMAQTIPGGTHLHLPSVLARLRIADTITLTPEGVTADEQTRLIRAMLKRGHRQFVLHYHSPSLSPGHTPYATDQSGARTVISRLQQICRFFFEEIGGVPGYPRDLLRRGGLSQR